MSDHSKKLGHGYKDVLKSIDQFFQQTYAHLAPIPIRITEKKDVWIAEAELPGVERKQINLEIYNQSIRIRVDQIEQSKNMDDRIGLTERQKRSYVRERLIPIPFLVNEHHVRATYKNGLLQIIIPNKHQQISID